MWNGAPLETNYFVKVEVPLEPCLCQYADNNIKVHASAQPENLPESSASPEVPCSLKRTSELEINSLQCNYRSVRDVPQYVSRFKGNLSLGGTSYSDSLIGVGGGRHGPDVFLGGATRYLGRILAARK